MSHLLDGSQKKQSLSRLATKGKEKVRKEKNIHKSNKNNNKGISSRKGGWVIYHSFKIPPIMFIMEHVFHHHNLEMTIHKIQYDSIHYNFNHSWFLS